MGPYVKSQTADDIDDGWEIRDGDDEVIAILDTELLADVIMNWLVNGGSPPGHFEPEELYGDSGKPTQEAGSHAPDCPYRQKGECDCWRSDPEQNPEARDADGA